MYKLDRREFLEISVASWTAAYGSDSRPRIVDLTRFLDSDFPRVRRPGTEAVVIHCTSIGSHYDFLSFLNTFLSLNSLLSSGNNAHYYISRGGTIYKTVPDDLVAPHAGASRWGGLRGLNHSSIGVEFQGFPDQPYTREQYDAFRWLYKDAPGSLKNRYDVEDVNVLYHKWIAICPNAAVHRQLNLTGKHTRPHRGRKPDPGFLFNRRMAGIYEAPQYDPDVRSGLLLPSPDPTRLVVQPDQRAMAVIENGKELTRYSVSVDGDVRKGRFSIDAKNRANVGIAPSVEIRQQGAKTLMSYDEAALRQAKGRVRIGSDEFFMVYDNALLGTPVEIM